MTSTYRIRKMPGGVWPGQWHAFKAGRLAFVAPTWEECMNGVALDAVIDRKLLEDFKRRLDLKLFMGG